MGERHSQPVLPVSARDEQLLAVPPTTPLVLSEPVARNGSVLHRTVQVGGDVYDIEKRIETVALLCSYYFTSLR